MKAVVLGAAGHIGNAIVRELIARGHEITAAGRRPEAALNLVGLPAHYMPGNLDTPGQIDAWIEGHDLVVDAAAPYPSRLLGGTEEADKNPLRYAVQRMQSVLDSVRRHRASLAYVSSFTTFIDKRTKPGWLRTQFVKQLHPYFAAKELMELEVLTAARNGLAAVIVNPTLCLGPWDVKERKYCFIPTLLRGEISTVVNQVLNVIDVRDVAVGLVTALEAQRFGEPILLSGHNISNEALFQWICETRGITPPRIVAPALLSVVASYWMEVTMEMAGLVPPMPALAAMLTYMHDWLPAGSAQSDLGLRPRPLSATIADAVRWYSEIGYC